jgi:DNA repair exonuclease SbcCD ATPase subunit
MTYRLSYETIERHNAELQQQLAAKDAEIEMLTRELSDAKLLAQNNLDWFNQLKPDFDAAIRQRDTLKEALEPYVKESAEALRKEEGWRTEVSEQLDDDADVGDYWALSITVKDIRRGIAALASLDQPADAAEGEKRD